MRVKTKAPMPTSIRILGRRFTVHIITEDPLDAGKLGTLQMDALRINLIDSQDPVGEADTLLHEVMHALCHLMRVTSGDDEEDIVWRLATGLTAVFQDNPEFGAYISEVR